MSQGLVSHAGSRRLSYLYHLTTLTDHNCTRGGEDVIMWVTIESVCCIFEMNMRLYINNTLIIRKKEDYHNTFVGPFGD